MRLTDGTIVLRPWEERDVEPAARATADPEIPRFTRVPEDNSAEQIRAFLAEESEDESFIIADPESDVLLGSAGLLRFDAENRRAEIGYWVAAEHRGRGIAPRAVELLFRHGVSAHGLHRLELHVYADNEPSRRVAEKAGFAFEGVLRGYELVKERRRDVAMYARLAG